MITAGSFGKNSLLSTIEQLLSTDVKAVNVSYVLGTIERQIWGKGTTLAASSLTTSSPVAKLTLL